MKKDKLFEPYYELGFSHFIFKEIMGLKRPSRSTQRFYLLLMFLILSVAFLT